ncbi:MAG: family 1 glycosylhydrolase [Chloroflexota bacterium]|nr:family 1 glycosylhydrolase [Chloroflexota bacterium]
MRYGIPWYRVNPAPGVFDWSWTDEVLEYMVRDLGIQPIVDLVHYGCPLWLEREFVSPEYPRRVAEYARNFVERYRGLTTYYTPLNEPLVNTRFCGYTGNWPPYLRGWRGYVRVLVALAEGMSRTVAAIREAQPGASIVHVEATSSYTTNDPTLSADLEFTRRRQFLPTDLLLGWVNDEHPLKPWLLQQGASPRTLEWLREHPQDIELFGNNYYPGISCYRLVRKNGVATRKPYYGGIEGLEEVVRAYHERYHKPVMITESSTRGPVSRREHWMDDSLAVVRGLRAEGVPVIGYTWWPMFSLVDWQYRRGGKILGEYLVHMGLWDLRDDGTGNLRREPTRLVDKFASCVANTEAVVGELRAIPR